MVIIYYYIQYNIQNYNINNNIIQIYTLNNNNII